MTFVVVAAVVGYLLGGVPTADWIGRSAGVHLRSEGSGNPGAHNALRVGGARLAATVLLVEMTKGVAAVGIGALLDAPVAAGLGAVAGNLANPYRRFRGGQGLGITAGVVVASWPILLIPLLATIGGSAVTTRSAPRSALVGIVVLVVAGIGWGAWGLPVAWGVPAASLSVLGPGLAALLAPKQLVRLSGGHRRGQPTGPA